MQNQLAEEEIFLKLSKKEITKEDALALLTKSSNLATASYHFEDLYLRDHTVLGDRVLLGVTHASLVTEKIFQKFGDCKNLKLTNLLFEDAIKVKQNEEVKILIELNEDKSIFEVFYQKNDSEKKRTASGAFGIYEAVSEKINLSSLKADLNKKISGTNFYDKEDRAKVWHGPSLHTVQEISYNDYSSFATLNPTKEILTEKNNYFIHPCYFDGAIVGALSIVMDRVIANNPNGPSYIPMFFKELNILGKLEEEVFSYAKLNKMNEEVITFDILIFNKNGDTLIKIQDFTCKRVKSFELPKKVIKKEFNFKKESVDSNKENIVKQKSNELEGSINEYLVNKIKKILDTTKDIDQNKNFIELGVDSNRLIEMSKELESELRVELYPTLFFEYQNVRELSDFFIKEHSQKVSEFFSINKNQLLENNESNDETDIGTSEHNLEPKNFDPYQKTNVNNEKNLNFRNKDIAVIGMSGRFAKSKNLNEFWQNLIEGKNLISEIPNDHFDFEPYFDPESKETKALNKMYCKWGSFIDDVDKFDADFFQVSPREAEMMDPQLRHFLEVIYETLENAGKISSIKGTNTGVYVGVCFHDYSLKFIRDNKNIDPYDGTGNSPTMLANRPSFFLDLKGPSLSVDTACSSSLVALDIAVKSLRNGDCEQAIVGGVNLLLSPEHYQYFCSIGALSKTGRSHSFDKKADGYVPGEAICAVMLKPLEKAIEDGDNIHAVIKGTAVNHGGHTNSVTAPSTKLETEVMLKAWSDAQIKPENITYIEAHGTGTELGDPIEFNATKAAFKQFTEKNNFCEIGSAKSHIGHAEGAAGIVGVIKVILSMKNKMIPCMPFFNELNPYVKLDNSALLISPASRKWIPKDESGNEIKRVAGVSSFGFGGAYAHAVIEEYFDFNKENRKELNSPEIIILSGKNVERLKQSAERLNSFLATEAGQKLMLRDIAYTLQIGRVAFEERLAVIVGSKDELKDKLADYLNQFEKTVGIYFGNIKQNKENDIDQQNDHTKIVEEISQGNLIAEELDKKQKILAELYVKGFDINWRLLHQNKDVYKVSLPTYPFEKERYWIELEPMIKNQNLESPALKSVSPNKNLIGKGVEDIKGRYLTLNWKEADLIKKEFFTKNTNHKILIVRDNSTYSKTLGQGLRERFKGCFLKEIILSDNYSEVENAIYVDVNNENYFHKLAGIIKEVDHICFINLNTSIDLEINLERIRVLQNQGVISLFRLLKAVLRESTKIDKKFKLQVITNNVYQIKEENININPSGSSTLGLAKVFGNENPEVEVICFDLDITEYESDKNKLNNEMLLNCIINEKPDNNLKTIVYRVGKKYIPELIQNEEPQTELKNLPIKRNGVYVIAGGAGGIGLVLSEYLLKEFHCNVALLGRSPLDGSKKLKLTNLNNLGGKIEYWQADITNKAQMISVIKDIKNKFGQINGFVHSAIVMKDQIIARMDEEDFKNTMSPKIDGSIVLWEVLKNEKLDFFLYFSSINSIVSNAGQSGYVVGCAFKDAFAKYLAVMQKQNVKVINWGYWGEVGVVSNNIYRTLMESQGVFGITRHEGLNALKKILSGNLMQMIYLKSNSKLLSNLGLKNRNLNEQSKNIFSIFDELDFMTGQYINKNKVDAGSNVYDALEGKRRLEEYVGLLVVKMFEEKNFFGNTNSISREDLRKRFNLIEKYNRLFDELLTILISQNLIKINDGDVNFNDLSSEMKANLQNLHLISSSIIEKHPSLKACFKLVNICFDNFVSILNGQKISTDVIFPNMSMELVEGIYAENNQADFNNDLVAEAVKHIVNIRLKNIDRNHDQTPQKIRILEIGAGTGGTSKYIFQKLKPHSNYVEYVYTDLSDAFLLHAQNKYLVDVPYLSFKKLDIEKSVDTQGFIEQNYDVVIASNVLHATKNIDVTIKNTRKLLKKNGFLLLNEITQKTRFLTMTFGLLDGWWLYKDAGSRLPGTPALSVEGWKKVLQENGFEKITNFSNLNLLEKLNEPADMSVIFGEKSSDESTFGQELFSSFFKIIPSVDNHQKSGVAVHLELELENNIVFNGHKIFDESVLATDALIELVYSVAKRSLNFDASCISEIFYYSPFRGSRKTKTLAKIEFSQKGNDYEFALFSKEDDLNESYKKNITGLITSNKQNNSTPFYYEKFLDVEKLVSSDEIYGQNYPVQLNDFYKTLTTLKIKGNQALGMLVLSQKYVSSDINFSLNPSLLAGVFAASLNMILYKVGNDSEVYIPNYVGRVEINSLLTDKQYYLNVQLKKMSKELFTFDVEIVDLNHNVVVRFIDLVQKKISFNDILRKDKLSNDTVSLKKHDPEEAMQNFSDDQNSNLTTMVENIVQNVKKVFADTLKKDLNRVDINVSMFEQGLDSLLGTEFVQRVNLTLNIKLQGTAVFEYYSIKKLSEYIANEYKSVLAHSKAVSLNQDSKVALSQTKSHSAKESSDSNFMLEKIVKPSENTNQIIQHDKNDKAVAIIGMSGRFAESENLKAFWKNLEAAKDLITEIPKDHWDYSKWFDENKDAPNKTYSKWGSFINGVDKFDPLFFDMSPLESVWVDPQLRLLLQVAYETFEDAGYAKKIKGSNTGVFIGNCFHEYWDEIVRSNVPFVDYQATSGAMSALSGGIAYRFDLQGASIPLDNACASSLTALHLAIRAIQNNEIEMAFVGGVNLLLSPLHYVSFSRMKALSSSGRCHTFDKSADGYVPGEGVAGVLLKPLSNAIADGDVIHAVIRGTSINHSGHGPNQTSPRSELQTKVILSAIEDADLNPETITYIECHGTGTELGDPIEINGLKNAFKKYTKKENYCALGSLKAHAGHLEGSAGLSGLIKVVLSMKHRKLPKMPNFKELNPMIELNKSPFFINTEVLEWKRLSQNIPLRAGISAFGMTGNNAHVILEEYVDSRSKVLEQNHPQLFILSAKNEERLKEYVEKYKDFLEEELENKKEKQINIQDLIHTLQIGREHFEERLACVIRSKEELKQKLEDWLRDPSLVNGVFRGNSKKSKEKEDPIYKAHSQQILKEISVLNVDNAEYQMKLEAVAQLFAKGFEIDFSSFYVNISMREIPRRISLPTYPFEKKSYWFSQIDNSESVQRKLEKKEKVKTVLHAMVDTDESTLEERIFIKNLSSDEFFIKDHVVGDHGVLPGVGYLEMARVSGDLADKTKKVLTIKNVIWAKPITVIKNSEKVKIILQTKNENDLISYSVETNDGLCSQGDLIYKTGALTNSNKKIDIQSIKANCHKVITKNHLYKGFEDVGLKYGPTFQSIEEININEVEAVSRLKLNNKIRETIKEFNLHPSLMDGALQTTAGILFANNTGSKSLALPFALNELVMHKAFMEECYVYAKVVEDKGTTKKFDITVTDLEGNLIVEFKGFSIREVGFNKFRETRREVPHSLTMAIDVKEKNEKLEEKIHEEAIRFFVDLFKKELQFNDSQIDIEAPFEKFGLDSIAINKLNNILDQYFSSLSKTLFFEYNSIKEISNFFAKEYREKFIHLLNGNVLATERGEILSFESSKNESLLPKKANRMQNINQKENDGIAIIGISGRYPQADDLKIYWNNLKSGKDCVSEIPKDRWEWKKYFDEIKDKPGAVYSKWGGFINNVDKFDPLFFNISPREAEIMDPQERLYLETAWHALEDSGYNRHHLTDKKIGVFVGVMWGEYQFFGDEVTNSTGQNLATSASYASIANRISYYLNLHGPSIAIDTMCSSSLTAIHLACQSIKTGETDMAIAGGVNVSIHPNKYISLAQGKFLSSDGHCKSFGQGGDGYVPGEGVGALILKSLTKAIEDGDHIYGVIKATKINHGGKTNGYTVPNPNLQADLIEEAILDAKINPKQLSYIEAHGTGTSLGDPIEITGLTKAFRKLGETENQFCSIGSVKSNIGHLEGAAGIAAISKVLLQMKHGKLVPSILAEDLNPNIDFAKTPFKVQRELGEWARPLLNLDGIEKEYPRIAGISSFGAGGSNAHVILEEYVDSRSKVLEQNHPQLFILSAKNEERLKEYVEKYKDFLEEELENKKEKQINIQDLIHTLQIGREHFEERLACVIRSKEELKQKLEDWLRDPSLVNGVFRGNSKKSKEKEDPIYKAHSQQILKEISVLNVDNAEYQMKLEAVAQLFTKGFEAKWEILRGDRDIRRINLPTYPFEKKRYWIGSSNNIRFVDEKLHPNGEEELVATEGERDSIYYGTEWEEAEISNTQSRDVSSIYKAYTDNEVMVVVGKKEILEELIVKEDSGSKVIGIEFEIGFKQTDENRFALQADNEADYVKLVGAIKGNGKEIKDIVYVSQEATYLTKTSEIQNKINSSLSSVFLFTKALINSKPKNKIKLIYLHNGDPVDQAVSGIAKTVRIENPKFEYRVIDQGTNADLINIITNELLDETSKAVEIRYNNGQRQEKRVIQLVKPALSGEQGLKNLKQNGVYLITGGAGGLGLIFAEYLAKMYQAKVVLSGRSQLSEEKQTKIKELVTKYGATIEYIAKDITNAKQAKELFQNIKDKYQMLDGMVHAAGVIKDSFILKKDYDQFKEVLSPKITGTINILNAIKEKGLTPEYIILFSSVASVMGNLGQCDYAAGNSFMNALAERNSNIISICWPLWREGGMHIDAASEQMMKNAMGMVPLETDKGLNAVEASITIPQTMLIVMDGEKEKIKKIFNVLNKALATKNQNAFENENQFDENDIKENLKEEIKKIISELIKVNIKDLDDDVELTEYGFDSVTLTELANRANVEFGVELTPASFFEYGSINKFTLHLIENYRDKLSSKYAKKIKVQINKQLGRPSETKVLSIELKNNSQIKRDKKLNVNDLKNERVEVGKSVAEIAVIGMAGKFPESNDLNEFWKNLESKKDLITEIPIERWDKNKYPGISKWGGFISDIDKFDSGFFQISPREAVLMDPQQRIFLEIVCQTIENAGYSFKQFRGTKTGLFVGIGSSDYLDLQREARIEIEAHTSTGGAHSIAANRISYLLDLRGPSEPIDTACSSSLVAIHRAIKSIQSGECDQAIAGGVNALLSPTLYISFNKAGMLSPDGKCKSFSKGANGYVRGEGVGAILLKPLSQAKKDGDRIIAIIQGTAVNHGGHVNSLTVPNPNAQAELIESALKDANMSSSQISYIETHGTGTELGDPIEVNALKKVFQNLAENRRQFCAIGSVKSNMGHLETAAGIAGVIKALLSLQNKKLPASINFTEINPYINLKDSPFYIQKETSEWHPKNKAGDSMQRVVGVSSFGFGGANAHIIISEYEDSLIGERHESNQPEIIILSGKNVERTKEYVRKLRDFLDMEDGQKALLRDMAYTFQVGRDAFEERFAVVVKSKEELKQMLEEYLKNPEQTKGIYLGNSKKSKEKENPIYIKQSRDVIKEIVKQDINSEDYLINLMVLAELFTKGFEIDWQLLHQGKDVRRVSLPTYPFEKKRYWIPMTSGQGVSNHTNGLVGNVSKLHPMVDVNDSTLEEQAFCKSLSSKEFFLKDHVVGDFCVLPGVGYLEMARASGNLASKSRQVTNIKNVIWAKPIAVNGIPELARVVLEPKDGMKLVSYSVSTGEGLHSQGELVYTDSSSQLSRPISRKLDIQSIKVNCDKVISKSNLYKRFESIGLKYGPTFQSIEEINVNGVEAVSRLKLNQSIKDTIKEFELHPSLMDAALQTTAGILFANNPDNKGLALPFALSELIIHKSFTEECYVHAKVSEDKGSTKKFDIDVTDLEGNLIVEFKGFAVREMSPDALKGLGTKKVLAQIEGSVQAGKGSTSTELAPTPNESIYYGTEWVEAEISNAQRGEVSSIYKAYAGNEVMVVVGKKGTLEDLAVNEDGGSKVIRIEFGTEFKQADTNHYEVQADNEADYVKLVGAIKGSGKEIKDIIYVTQEATDLTKTSEVQNKVNSSLSSVFLLTKALINSKPKNKVKLLYIHSGDLIDESVSGIAKTVRLENPKFEYRVIKQGTNADLIKIIINELLDETSKAVEIRYNNRQRQEKRVVQLEESEATTGNATNNTQVLKNLKQNGVYLITGGAGGLGLIFAEYLAKTYQAKVILSGRSILTEEKQEKIQELTNKYQTTIEYSAKDITDTKQANELLKEIREKYQTLDGVIHAAGVIKDAFILKKEFSQFKEVLTPKISGTINILNAIKEQGLAPQHIILFSSVASVMGNLGQCDYASGNSFMNALAERNQDTLPTTDSSSTKVVSICWPLWREGGMHIDATSEQMMKSTTGMVPLETEEGLSAFEALITIGKKNINQSQSSPSALYIVMEGDKNKICATFNINNKKFYDDLKYKNVNQVQLIQVLKEMFCDLLKIEHIDVNKNLIEYGLDSILGMEAMNRIQQKFNFLLSPDVFFSAGSIDALTTLILEDQSILKDDIEEKPEHPFIDRVEKSNHGNEVTIHKNYSLQGMPWFEDHVVLGIPRLQAVSYLEMIVAGLRQFEDKSYLIEKVNLYYPISVFSDKSNQAITNIKKDLKGYFINIKSLINNKAFKNADALVSILERENNTGNQLPDLTNYHVHMTGDQFFNISNVDKNLKLGNYAGPYFHGISKIFKHKIDETYLAELDLSGKAKKFNHQFYLHPGLLDPVVYICIYLSINNHGSSINSLPIYFEKVKVYRPVNSKCYALITFDKSKSVGDIDKFKINFFDPLGNKLLSIDNLFLKKVNNPELSRKSEIINA